MTSPCNYFMLIWFLVLIFKITATLICVKDDVFITAFILRLKALWILRVEITTFGFVLLMFSHTYISTCTVCVYCYPQIVFFFLLITSAALFWPFSPWEWLASNFSFQYHPLIKHLGHENKGNDTVISGRLPAGNLLILH